MPGPCGGAPRARGDRRRGNVAFIKILLHGTLRCPRHALHAQTLLQHHPLSEQSLPCRPAQLIAFLTTPNEVSSGLPAASIVIIEKEAKERHVPAASARAACSASSSIAVAACGAPVYSSSNLCESESRRLLLTPLEGEEGTEKAREQRVELARVGAPQLAQLSRRGNPRSLRWGCVKHFEKLLEPRRRSHRLLVAARGGEEE